MVARVEGQWKSPFPVSHPFIMQSTRWPEKVFICNGPHVGCVEGEGVATIITTEGGESGDDCSIINVEGNLVMIALSSMWR